MSRFRLSPERLLNIQVSALGNSIPDVVYVGETRREVELSSAEKEAAKLAIWYIVKRAWGQSAAIRKASGSFGRNELNKSNVVRAVKHVFPNKYFQALEKSKNYNLLNSLQKEE
jgi:hypothetical protein